MAEKDPSYYMPYQYGNEANPRAHYEHTAPEILDELDSVAAFVGAALASTGPAPGTSISRQPSSVDRALALTRRSFSSTWSFTSPN